MRSKAKWTEIHPMQSPGNPLPPRISASFQGSLSAIERLAKLLSLSRGWPIHKMNGPFPAPNPCKEELAVERPGESLQRTLANLVPGDEMADLEICNSVLHPRHCLSLMADADQSLPSIVTVYSNPLFKTCCEEFDPIEDVSFELFSGEWRVGLAGGETILQRRQLNSFRRSYCGSKRATRNLDVSNERLW